MDRDKFLSFDSAIVGIQIDADTLTDLYFTRFFSNVVGRTKVDFVSMLENCIASCRRESHDSSFNPVVGLNVLLENELDPIKNTVYFKERFTSREFSNVREYMFKQKRIFIFDLSHRDNFHIRSYSPIYPSLAYNYGTNEWVTETLTLEKV